ncbi:MAG: hypothetical protein NC131_21155 [Roseburia sp.]|nr:hypothetical protein [Roseburia sp.]
MDLLELFKATGQLFMRYFSITFTVGSYRVSVGAIFIFVGIVGIIMKFIRGLSD